MYHSRNEPDKQSSYMDGIPVKISELYKPPKKITLPVGIVNRQPIEHFEEYDFRLERSTAEKMSRLRELKEANKEKRRQRLAAENKRLEELKKAAETTAKQTDSETSQDGTPTQEIENPDEEKTSKGASYVNPICDNMLTPVPFNHSVPVQSINSFNPKSGSLNQHFNISDFESDSSPFDNMELKTLNDIAELASVLQPNNDVPKPTYQNYQSTEDVPKPTYHTYQDNNQLYNHQSYPIKHSRTFIQQPGNLVPNNGYTYGNVYNNTSVSDPNQSFWDQQQAVSYSSTRTTPSTVFGASVGVTSPYTTELGVYTSQNSDIHAVRPKIGEYRLNVGENTVYSSDYRPKIGESAGYLSDFRPNTQEIQTQNRPGDNTGYLGNEYAHQYIPQTVSKFGGTSSTNNGVYASKFGGTSSTNLGANSEYGAKFRGSTASTVNLGTTNNYLMQAQGVMNSRGSETEDTSEYLNAKIGAPPHNLPSSNACSDYMKPISSDYMNHKIGSGSKHSVNYAPAFSWSNYNYGATNLQNNSESHLVVNHLTDNLESHLASQNSENRLLVGLSENSDVTNLIRELKVDLDDRRENDSRKMMENERIMAASAAVENDKLRQKVSKPEAAPLLPNPMNQLTSSCRNLVLRISEMGFAQERVARAVERLGDNETKVLEFLLQLQRLEEDSGCTGERVELALVNNRYDTVESVRYLEVLQQLLDLGFNEAKVAEALVQHANDRDKALESLIS